MTEDAAYASRIHTAIDILEEKISRDRRTKTAGALMDSHQRFTAELRGRFPDWAPKASSIGLLTVFQCEPRQEMFFGYFHAYAKGFVIFFPRDLGKNDDASVVVRINDDRFSFLTAPKRAGWCLRKTRPAYGDEFPGCPWVYVSIQPRSEDDIRYGISPERWEEMRPWLETYLPLDCVYAP